MLKFNELQEGNLVMAEYEGQQWEGVVEELNREDKEVAVQTEVQQFWFTPEHLYPIVLTEEYLFKLGFTKEILADGKLKYLKEAFRMVVPDNGKFSPLEIWYREDHRLLANPLYVHELQNHYYDMTKVELNAV